MMNGVPRAALCALPALVAAIGISVFSHVANAQPRDQSNNPSAAPRQQEGRDQPSGEGNDQHEPFRNVKEYNLPKSGHLAIRGYDPVAYFEEGGGEAKKGSDKITFTYKGVTYRFATAEHQEQFKQNPARYEPTYGGWCAWAMAKGEKADIDPTKFIVKDDRLFLFYDGFLNDTRAKWKRENHEELTTAADEAWKKMTGEEPRYGSKAEEGNAPDAGSQPNEAPESPGEQPS